MEHEIPFDFPANGLGLDKPVIVGEVQPTSVEEKLHVAEENGYAGVLFWSLNADYDFAGVAEQFDAYFGL